MYGINQQLLKDIKNPNRDIDIKVYIDGVQLGKEEIENIEVEYSLGNNGIPAFGGVSSTMITLNLLKIGNTPQIFNARKIEPYIGIYDSSTTLHWIPLGIFYPKKKDIKNTKIGVEITAFDKISDIDNRKFYSKLVYPVGVKDLIKEIAEHLNVNIKNLSELPNLIYKKVPDNKSARVVLSEIAQLTGFNCFINRVGELEFKRYKKVQFELDAENVVDFTLQSDELINISKLIAKDSSNKELEYGDDTGYSIELTTKKATKEILKNIYESITKTYIPYEMECQGMPHIEPGDIIKFTNIDGVESDILIAEHRLNITGGLISEFSCQAMDDDGYTLGTLDDAYNDKLSGDTSERLEDIEEKTIFLENDVNLEVNTNDTTLINTILSLEKDNENATMNFTACILSSEQTLLELFIDNNGNKYPFEPKQILAEGYNLVNFCIPLFYLQDDVLNLLKIRGTLTNGSATIQQRQMQVIIKGSRLSYGSGLPPFAGATIEYKLQEIITLPKGIQVSVVLNSDKCINDVSYGIQYAIDTGVLENIINVKGAN